MIWLIALHVLWILVKGIHFIYLLERKQYRLHRFQSMIHDRGFFILFYSINIRLPTKSIRNILIATFHILTTSIFVLYAFENIYVYDFLTYYVPLAPFVAFAIVVTGVILTQIPAAIYQQIVMLIAAWKVRRSNAQFIAITGSYGKSEVGYILKEILSKKYNVASTEENMNTEMGIAQSILRHLKQDTNIMIIEAATYSTGQINRETSYIPFSRAILTGIGNQHVDLFPSREALIAEESSIVSRIGSQGVAYVNEQIQRLPTDGQGPQTIRYGFSSRADIVCRDFHLTSNGSMARFTYNDVSIKIQTELLGRYALLNMLPAIACASDLGIKPHEIRQIIRTMNRREGRITVHRGEGQAVYVMDKIDPSVESVENAIDLLRRFPQKNKIIVVSPLTELGGERRGSYEKIMSKSEQHEITMYLLHPGHGIKERKPYCKTFNDVSSLRKSLHSRLNKGTVVVLEGLFPSDFVESLISS